MNREKELWEKMEGKEVRIDWLSAKLRSIYDSGCKFHGYVMMFSKRQLEVFEGGQSVVLWGTHTSRLHLSFLFLSLSF